MSFAKSDVSNSKGLSLLEFMHKKCGNQSISDICNQLEGKLDFENWSISKIIGKGAFAKVYLVQRNVTFNSNVEVTRK